MLSTLQNYIIKTAREFLEELAAHLGATFKEMSVHCEKGTFYHNLTLTAEIKKQYTREYGYNDDAEFLARLTLD